MGLRGRQTRGFRLSANLCLEVLCCEDTERGQNWPGLKKIIVRNLLYQNLRKKLSKVRKKKPTKAKNKLMQNI